MTEEEKREIGENVWTRKEGGNLTRKQTERKEQMKTKE
jgi:hypothetical protein